MMHNLITKRKAFTPLMITFVIILSLLFQSIMVNLNVTNYTAFAAEGSSSTEDHAVQAADLKGHWAEGILSEWLNAGTLQGYPDGTIRPDQSILRGEVIALINRSLGLTERADIQFRDLTKENWEYDDVRKAVQAEYVEGYPDETIRTKQSISRQESAVIIARLLNLNIDNNDGPQLHFTDAEQIPEWSIGAIIAVASAGIMEGYLNGSFSPATEIKRSEMIVALHRAIKYAEELDQNNEVEEEGNSEDDKGEEVSQPEVPVYPGGGGSTPPQLPQLAINSVTAQNGVVEVALNRSPDTVPVIEDFAVHQSINGENQALVTPGEIAWDAGTHTAALKVPFIPAGNTELSVVYSVSYKELTAVDSAPFIIKRELVIADNGEANAVIIAKEVEVVSPDVPLWIKRAKPAKMSLVNTKSHSGTKSVMFNNDVANEPFGLESQAVPINEGATYEASVMYWLSSDPAPRGEVTMYLRFFDKNKTRLSNDFVYGAVQDEWTKLSIIKTAPVGAVEAHVYLYANTNGPRLMYFDDASLESTNGGVNLLADANGDFEQFSYEYAASIDTLIKYVHKSTNARLPIVHASEEADQVQIYIGYAHAADQAYIDAQLTDLDPQGFVIYPNENRLTIVGPTETGTYNGVIEFLERYVGVQWLFPGEHGEDVPQLPKLSVPVELVRDEPAFTFRMFSPMQGTSGPLAEWAGRNKLQNNINTRLKFHHNLYTLFPVEKFGESNPEFYPNASPPKPGVFITWQPCFSDEDTIPVAVAGIIDYFDKNPDASSFSLGINDSRVFCETQPGESHYKGPLNSAGDIDLSDVYYTWVNEVVTQVTEANDGKYSDKLFGLLAYTLVFDPPSFDLHPNVIPVITKDRMIWIDDEVQSANKQHQQDWSKKASQIAWYDYMYGVGYAVPRVYPQLMAENYEFAEKSGVIGHYAEIYTNLGEGPKQWVSAKLQWDPTQDVDELLQEWYRRAVGEAAAEDLAAYFEIWEGFWMERVQDLPWFQNRKNTMYLQFSVADYLERVTEADLAQGRQLMESVRDKAVTDEHKARAELLFSTFEYYEATALSYAAEGTVKVPVSEQEAIASLDYIKQSLDMAQKRRQLIEEFKSEPALAFPIAPRYDWDGVQYWMFGALQQYVEQEEPGGAVGQLVADFLADLPLNIKSQFLDIPVIFEAYAQKTTASKEQILQSFDFSQGPWTDAHMFKDYLVMGSKTELPAQETRTYLLWDDENLYVGYENLDDNISAIVASDNAPDSWWFGGANDSIETYVTGDQEGSFKGFFTNPKGVNFVRQQDPGSTQAPVSGVQWDTTAEIFGDRWNAIQVIPFAEIGVDPSETKTLMGMFFRNLRGNRQYIQYIGWGGGASWKPEEFKPIYLVE